MTSNPVYALVTLLQVHFIRLKKILVLNIKLL